MELAFPGLSVRKLGGQGLISKLRVRRVTVKVSHDRALALIREAVRAYRFEITETMDLNAFVRQRTGTCLNGKTTVLQLDNPVMILGNALLDNNLPLIFPLRMILREIDRSSSVLHFPDWEVVKASEDADTQYCMDILYRETLGRIAASIQETLAEEDIASTARQLT